MSLLTSGVGCATPSRVVLVDPDKTILRAGPNMRGRVYFKQDGKWVLGDKVTIPEGWYIGTLGDE